jgi:ABC-2 type transport system ATP-binding protein
MLEVDGLTKRYGPTLALSNLSFSVRPGEVYGFVGANGAGKTTAMRIMLGVLVADSGQVRWQGQPVTFETRRRFGYMPEERGLYPKMRVTEHLVYLARLHGLDQASATRSADELTERLGVAERRNDAIEKLSLGSACSGSASSCSPASSASPRRWAPARSTCPPGSSEWLAR